MKPIARFAPVLLFVAIAALYLPFTIDDAYISMRYADNWSRGAGLVFNPGERVEGFSNFLWVALLAVGATVGAPLPILAKGLGLVCGAAVIGLLAADRFGGGRFAAWLCAASGGLAYHSVAGLETGLYALTLLLLVRLWQDRPLAARGGLLGAVALAAALTRPEAAAVLLAVVGVGLLRWPWRARLALVSCAMVAVGLELLRHRYFGAWLPNTSLAKPGVASLGDFVAGLQYLHAGLIEDGRYFELALVVALLVHLRSGRDRHWPRLFVWVLGSAFAVWTGGDWMARARYLVPYIPVLASLAGESIAALARRDRSGDPLARLVVGAVVIVRGLSAVAFAADLRAGGRYDHAHVSTGNVAVGRWFLTHTAADATVLTDEIGAVGFYGERRVLDLWGLIDPTVARVYHDLGFNPYGAAGPPAVRHEAQSRVVAELLARRVDYVLVDYRGSVAAPYHRDGVIPVTMRELRIAIEARGFRPVERFVLDSRLPKSLVLFRASARPPTP